MKNIFVVHLSPVKNSVQASARIARFIAEQFECPIIDDEEAIQKHFVKPGLEKRSVDVIIVNGPLAFSKILDSLGDNVFPKVKRVFWVQNDYTVYLPPNKNYSRPSTAETPFRKNFYKIPEVVLWSTCEDWLSKRNDDSDRYINWNALTYAPFKTSTEAEDRKNRLFYYGAFRKDREEAFARYLDSKFVTISVSLLNKNTIKTWGDVAGNAKLKGPAKVGKPTKALNGNHLGENPLLRLIDTYRHSIYMSDKKSLEGLHSPANRLYEVLSTPGTILWLERDGRDAYKKFKMEGYKDFIIKSTQDWKAVNSMSAADCLEMAKAQRDLWIPKDPYKRLVKSVQKIKDEL